MVGFFLLASCEGQKEHTAPAVHDRDSASMMISYGVNTLISDSGVIKYRIVTERWEVNTVRNPSRWIFEKGLFFEQFDEKFHVQSYIPVSYTHLDVYKRQKNAEPQDNENYKEGLEPWVDEHSEILILGSFPSDVSLRERAYYQIGRASCRERV